jgi:hypothetical protein
VHVTCDPRLEQSPDVLATMTKTELLLLLQQYEFPIAGTWNFIFFLFAFHSRMNADESARPQQTQHEAPLAKSHLEQKPLMTRGSTVGFLDARAAVQVKF